MMNFLYVAGEYQYDTTYTVLLTTIILISKVNTQFTHYTLTIRAATQ